jgi:hypothetical protein
MDDIQIEPIQPEQVDVVIELFTHYIYEGNRDQAVMHLAGHREGEADTFVAYAGRILAGFLTLMVRRNAYMLNGAMCRMVGVPVKPSAR